MFVKYFRCYLHTYGAGNVAAIWHLLYFTYVCQDIEFCFALFSIQLIVEHILCVCVMCNS